MPKPYTLYAAQGGGSMLIEIALEMARAPYEIVDVAWEDTGWNSKLLKDLNPLGQVPVLVAPDGAVMTESAAIFLSLSEQFPAAQLSPAPGAPERAAFLRWLTVFVSAIYPTFTYGDVTARWVGEGEKSGAGKALRAATDDHRKMLYRFLEGQVRPDPWLLGKTFSALDLYVWVFSYWRPGREWMKSECPALFRIATAAGASPVVEKVRVRNKLS
jgi:GST-like protein